MDVRLKGGRKGSFEVTFGDEVIHSKLGTGEWPDEEQVLASIARRLPR